jgi:hypothetical protein
MTVISYIIAGLAEILILLQLLAKICRRLQTAGSTIPKVGRRGLGFSFGNFVHMPTYFAAN